MPLGTKTKREHQNKPGKDKSRSTVNGKTTDDFILFLHQVDLLGCCLHYKILIFVLLLLDHILNY